MSTFGGVCCFECARILAGLPSSAEEAEEKINDAEMLRKAEEELYLRELENSPNFLAKAGQSPDPSIRRFLSRYNWVFGLINRATLVAHLDQLR